ncbi:hypothetical protein SKAU_G00358400 [Synaphobranchus kaupii]|uniref:Uncharacterized protein n=1 Tax=Synaphobranchus kaupii TaxID=118154 RepID=A0A9Q1EHU1_SYNKA|nr:hypothetical protein SKAU_G00358400 [Synaphobranchus kaupii]
MALAFRQDCGGQELGSGLLTDPSVTRGPCDTEDRDAVAPRGRTTATLTLSPSSLRTAPRPAVEGRPAGALMAVEAAAASETLTPAATVPTCQRAAGVKQVNQLMARREASRHPQNKTH